MFIDQQGNAVKEFKESNLQSLTAVSDVSLDQLFEQNLNNSTQNSPSKASSIKNSKA
jgi:hypothetical protein